MFTNVNHSRLFARGMFFGLVLASFLFVSPAHAATSVTTSELPVDVYMALKAKVEYLTAVLNELTDGRDGVPDPTFAMALRGNVAQINGTIARKPTDVIETCGPMTKGTVDWGDGVVETLYGLGCSGDVFTFERYHVYETPGSYKITVAGERRTSKVIAPGSSRTDTSDMLAVSVDAMTVSASGEIALDEAFFDECEDVRIGIIDWGDGTADYVSSEGCETAFDVTHTYVTPGTYTILVRDAEGDATHKRVVIE